MSLVQNVSQWSKWTRVSNYLLIIEEQILANWKWYSFNRMTTEAFLQNLCSPEMRGLSIFGGVKNDYFSKSAVLHYSCV